MKSQVFDIIALEEKRQKENIELIASENFVSENVMKAVGSVFTNKYCEGYAATRMAGSGNRGRYYGGCQNADLLEEYCIQLWKRVFKTVYHVNVQPHSGTQANMAAYAAVLKPGDKILSMELSSGGHLSHGSPVSMAGKLYEIHSYKLKENGYIDLQDFQNKIMEIRPNLILAGASAYPRNIPFDSMADIIDKCKMAIYLTDTVRYEPIFMVDMAHIAGLVATGLHTTPFGFADIITTTTHKTLRGPRGGLIFCKNKLASKIDSAVFPMNQGGPLMHVIAGKAVCAEEALEDSYKMYIHEVVRSCSAMADEFTKLGFHVVTGGTDNHLLLLDFSDTHPHVTGQMVQDKLDKLNITLNKNSVPGDKRSYKETSGVRIGTAPMCSKGWVSDDFVHCASVIADVVNQLEEEHKND